jgi:hypothetical protein
LLNCLLFSLPIMNLSAPVDPHSSANSVASSSSSCSDSNYDSGAFSRTSSPEISTPIAARVAVPPPAANIALIPDFSCELADTQPPFLASTPSHSSPAVSSLPLVLPPLVSPPLVLSMVRSGRGGGGGDFAEGQLVLACLSAAAQTSSFDTERLALGKLIFFDNYNMYSTFYSTVCSIGVKNWLTEK